MGLTRKGLSLELFKIMNNMVRFFQEKGDGPECVYGGNHKDPLDPLKPFFEVVDLS